MLLLLPLRLGADLRSLGKNAEGVIQLNRSPLCMAAGRPTQLRLVLVLGLNT